MAKRSSTINLENKIWEKIMAYAKANGINRNTAIEWIVLQHETLTLRVADLPPTQLAATEVPIQEENELETGTKTTKTNIDLLEVMLSSEMADD